MIEPGESVAIADRDLFFVAKIRETLKHLGWQEKIIKTPEDMNAMHDERPAIVLVHFGVANFDWQGIIKIAQSLGVPVLAYGSHVDTDAQVTARQLGATRVIPNSKLARDLPGEILQTIDRLAANKMDDKNKGE
jgi:hypothetical protein